MEGNVQPVVDKGLCVGCGTCVAVCPDKAITMIVNRRGVYVAKVKQSDCTQCGTCSKVCPGQTVDFDRLNDDVFGKKPNNYLLGNYLGCYIGYSTDEKIRYQASSGGAVTQLLVFALEQKIIDGALVTRMSRNNPLVPEPFIARTREEIVSASKSKYCPVAANIALNRILNEKGRFAVVGLPCHLHGVRKAALFDKRLRDRIVLHLGIFCGRGVTFLGTEFYLQKKGIRKENVERIDYRGEGWPGKISVALKNGTTERFRRSARDKTILDFVHSTSAFHFHFVPARCLVCCDETNELADISFGDPWLPELKSEEMGQSLIVTRSKVGEEILQQAKMHKEVELYRVTSDKILQSQGKGLLHKKNLKPYFCVFHLLGRVTPHYNYNTSTPLKSKLADYLNAIISYFQLCLSSTRYLWPLLCPYTLMIILAVRCRDNVKKLARFKLW